MEEKSIIIKNEDNKIIITENRELLLNDKLNNVAREITVGQQVIASSVGALITSLIVTPMDVVKIRLQKQVQALVHNQCLLYSNGYMDHFCTNCENLIKPLSKCEWFSQQKNFNGTLLSTSDAFVKITRHEGFLSLWSGLSPTLLSTIPATVFYFTIYDNISNALRKRINNKFFIPLISGTIARSVAVTFVSPLELIRTKMQSQKHSYKDLYQAIKRTILKDGYLSLWRGLPATLMRDIPFSAIYWTGYECFKHKSTKLINLRETNFLISFLCGASAGTIAAIATTPFDVVKTHQQITLGTQYNLCKNQINNKKDQLTNKYNKKSLLEIMRNLKHAKGTSALFAGLVPRVARVAPACAIMIGSYEYLKIFFKNRNAAIES